MYHNLIKILLSRLILSLFLLFLNTYHVAVALPTNTVADGTETSNTVNSSSQNLTPDEIQKTDIFEKINSITTILDTLQAEIQSNQSNIDLNSSKVNSMIERLTTSEKKLQELSATLSKNDDSIKKNAIELANLIRKTQGNTTESSLQKSLIEDNSIRLYEILVKINTIREQLLKISSSKTNKQQVDSAKNEVQFASDNNLNTVWLLLSIILISLAPIAFILSSSDDKYHHLKDGTPHRQGIILVSLGVFLGYFLVGFGIMYGDSLSGWIGVSSYILDNPAQLMDISSSVPFYHILLYQMGFSVLASLIIYTAVGRLLSAISHMLLSLFTGGILIPIFGHWVWAEQFITSNKGWLAGMGFVDQSGATVIHTIAAFFTLIIIIQLGKIDKPLKTPLRIIGDFPVYSSSATLFLWISWQGLTTGTLTINDAQISPTILNNGLAASSAGIMAFMHYVFFHPGKGKISRGLSGVITGLVAISACATTVTAIEAIVIGAIAGILQNISFSFLHGKLLRKDTQIPAAYLISIHGAGGIWGTLCVALLGTEGSFTTPNTIQMTVQVQGIMVAIIYSMVMGYIVAMFFKPFELKRQQKLKNSS